MNSRIKTDVKKIFEYWCELNCNGIRTKSFPDSFRDDKTIHDIPSFAFPCPIESDSVQSYSFVLTTDDSKWRFGFCRHEPKNRTAMVLITYLPWHDTFLRFLAVLAELRRNDDEQDFVNFITEVYGRNLTDGPIGNVKFFYCNGLSNFVFETPSQFKLPSIPENHNLNLYYNFVDPKNMIAVFASMLAERRIIFTSRHLDRLSSCIQAAHAFLYPMVWQHIFIPILPMKLKDYLCAPMPYLIGVPEQVFETMMPEELGEVVVLNCDTKIFDTPFDDVHELPHEIVSQLKKQLSNSHEHIGDRVSKIFLGALVQLIGTYRDGVEFRQTKKTFNRETFIESRPSHLRPFLTKMMELQIFQQFIDERIDMLNTGLGVSDEFEVETAKYAEKMKKRGRNLAFLKNVKDKTNPAVKSAVKSVKESSRGVKTAYRDLKSKLRDITPPTTSSHFRSHLASNSQHDRIDGVVIKSNSLGGHYSAPNSPIFNKRSVSNLSKTSTGGLVNYPGVATNLLHVNERAVNGKLTTIAASKRNGGGQPLATSNSSTHIYTLHTHAAVNHNNHLGASPTVSPASSLCSSDMNLSQELQNHPLFKSPAVDRSLKPAYRSANFNQKTNNSNNPSRSNGLPPRPPPPALSALQNSQTNSRISSIAKPVSSTSAALSPVVSYYNHPYLSRRSSSQLQFTPREQMFNNTLTLSSTLSPSSSSAAQSTNIRNSGRALLKSSTLNRCIQTTDSIFDNPPEMQSPPVPPRRQFTANGNACCADATITTTTTTGNSSSHFVQAESTGNEQRISLKRSPSSNTSTASSSCSNASFFSALSSLSQLTSTSETTPVPVDTPLQTPVPVPRNKKNDKESFRSLQLPNQMSSTYNNDLPNSNDTTIISTHPQQKQLEDDLNKDLISLGDSGNNSFDLEDFDPLNQNARPFPPATNKQQQQSQTQQQQQQQQQHQPQPQENNLQTNHLSNQAIIKSTILPVTSTNTATNKVHATNSISNPLYPFFTPQHSMSPPPLPTTAPPPMPLAAEDDDFELLRRYGLDQFTLTTQQQQQQSQQQQNGPTANGVLSNINGTSKIINKKIAPSATATAPTATPMRATGMSNWTTFD